MKNIHYLLGIALLLVGTLPTFSQVSNDNEDDVYKIDPLVVQNDFVPGQVLVKFKDENPVNVNKSRGMFRSVSVSTIDMVLKEFNVETMDKLLPNEKPKPIGARRKAKAFNGQDVVENDLSQLYVIKMQSLRQDSTLLLVEKLNKLNEVEFAEPNYKVYIMGQVPQSIIGEEPVRQALSLSTYSTETTDDVICADPNKNPLFSQQWGITKMNINALWTKPIINKKRPVIAILDTGVDISHPDLVDNIWTNIREAEGEANYDNDGNGFIGDVHGWDFINSTANIRDYNSHGTHVAGIAAASDNEIGVVGANPKALIMPVTVMQSDGTGDISVVVQGIQYAIDNGASIISMSLGTYANSYALKQVLEHAYQTTIIVASAGNDHRGLTECGDINSQTMYPAGYAFVLGVQSGQDGILDGFSNFDCNGPTYSEYSLDFQENYELIAPGKGILSSVPNGKYKILSGTSMSTPLVAGAISALRMVKEYDTQEMMWADLIHTECDFLKTYNVADRPAEIEVLTLQWSDSDDGGNGDGYYDAGETVRFYPVVRTVWGEASNVKCHMEIADENENARLIEIIKNDAELGCHLSTYAYHQFMEPIIFRISEECADARRIKLKLTVSCDESINSVTQEFVITVDNIVKLEGLLNEDKTLKANHRYLISDDVAVAEGATLTIEPGTNIVFRSGKSIYFYGEVDAHGEPGKMITFSPYIGDEGNYGIFMKNYEDQTLSYCYFRGASVIGDLRGSRSKNHLENCIIQYSDNAIACCIRCNIIDSRVDSRGLAYTPASNNNVINNTGARLSWHQIPHSNYFNNVYRIPPKDQEDNYYMLEFTPDSPQVDTNDNPSYLGTSRADLVIPHIRQMGYQWETNNGFGETDLSNMLTEPVHEAHGIVWKVLINGFDPQDEYEIMPVLGIGKHKFEVYFNRPMNKARIPNVAFGVRSPYSQNAVDEEGFWNEEGTIYTAYKTITGKTQSNGQNRVYVWGAEDDELFECPYENFRFRFDIQSAGTLATGFVAEAGLGKVQLTWNNENNDFDDAMGFNIYRYTINEAGEADTLCINKEIVDIETTEYTDYDVTPGTTYYYLYKVLSTDLKEFDVSNVVAATPLTSKLGDANGSGEVDVADVITTVNYAAGQQPKPFIFEAADMNTDQSIDILDVIGIIKVIMNPNAEAQTAALATATYTVEDGVVYVDSPVALAGVQLQLALPSDYKSNGTVTVADDLKGFEHTSAWLSDNDYLFLAYNMNGKTLIPGKHAMLNIGNGQITNIRLSDAYGHNVEAISGEATVIDRMGSNVMTVKGVYNLSGQKVAGNTERMKKLPKGVYIINGQKVVK